jgi:ABC-2 type transport system ATP-binding protein
MPAEVVRFTQVRKSYGPAVVLRDVDLGIGQGEYFGLAGVNGAGKTTLIKCMLDFCAVDGGRIELFGLPHREPRSRARVAFLPERFVPPYYLTGRDFLRFMLALQERPYVQAEVQAMLDALDLDPGALAAGGRTRGMTRLVAAAPPARPVHPRRPMSGLTWRAGS